MLWVREELMKLRSRSGADPGTASISLGCSTFSLIFREELADLDETNKTRLGN